MNPMTIVSHDGSPAAQMSRKPLTLNCACAGELDQMRATKVPHWTRARRYLFKLHLPCRRSPCLAGTAFAGNRLLPPPQISVESLPDNVQAAFVRSPYRVDALQRPLWPGDPHALRSE